MLTTFEAFNPLPTSARPAPGSKRRDPSVLAGTRALTPAFTTSVGRLLAAAIPDVPLRHEQIRLDAFHVLALNREHFGRAVIAGHFVDRVIIEGERALGDRAI